MMDTFIDDFISNNLSTLNELDEKKKRDKGKIEQNLNIDFDFSKFSKLENLQIDDIRDEIKSLIDRNINLKKQNTLMKFFFAQKSLLLQILDKS